MSRYYILCNRCGASLNPGETRTCMEESRHMIETSTIPDIKTVNKDICWMIRVGGEIKADNKKLPPENVSDKEILRKVDISPNQLSGLLREEFVRCITRKRTKRPRRGTRE